MHPFIQNGTNAKWFCSVLLGSQTVKLPGRTGRWRRCCVGPVTAVVAGRNVAAALGDKGSVRRLMFVYIMLHALYVHGRVLTRVHISLCPFHLCLLRLRLMIWMTMMIIVILVIIILMMVMSLWGWCEDFPIPVGIDLIISCATFPLYRHIIKVLTTDFIANQPDGSCCHKY